MHRRVPLFLVIAILVLVVASLASYAYFGDTLLKQNRRMSLGRRFLSTITNVVHSYPQFSHVQVGVGTANVGSFLVVGMVDTRAQLSELQDRIAATKPPLEVVYRLKILEDYSATPSAEPVGPANPGSRSTSKLQPASRGGRP